MYLWAVMSELFKYMLREGLCKRALFSSSVLQDYLPEWAPCFRTNKLHVARKLFA